jgi:hypothetical protein
MREPNIAERLPDGYLFESSPRGMLALAREFAPALQGAGYGLSSDGASTPSALTGRKPLLELPTSAGVFLVRRFSHGGLLRFLTRERFLDPERPFRELAVSHSLSRAGVDTPVIAAARARRAPGWGWRLEIVTRRVEGTIDLDEALALARSGRIDRRALARLARAAGRLVRALHDAGCRHADLTTKNMLVERSLLDDSSMGSNKASSMASSLGPEMGPKLAPRMWILDLDRASLVARLGSVDRSANLARLHRYVLRRERMHGPGLARTDWMRFLAAYEPDRTARKAWASAIQRAYSRSLPWHALGWRLEKLF